MMWQSMLQVLAMMFVPQLDNAKTVWKIRQNAEMTNALNSRKAAVAKLLPLMAKSNMKW